MTNGNNSKKKRNQFEKNKKRTMSNNTIANEKITDKDMINILRAKLSKACRERNAYATRVEFLERHLETTEWNLTAYVYKYEKNETIEKLLKLTDKYKNIVISSRLLNRISIVEEQVKSKHTYLNHIDPITKEIVVQYKKTKNNILLNRDKPMYYTMKVGYTEHKVVLRPYLKTTITQDDLNTATSMFDFELKQSQPKKAKKVKKVMIDDDPILPNEPQYNPKTKKIEKPKKVKKVMIDDDP